jgi:excisionase family DNA binding protein
MTCLSLPVKENLSREEAANLLKVSGRTINRYISSGRLRARYTMVGSYPRLKGKYRRLRLKRRDLVALMKGSETEVNYETTPTIQKTNGAPVQECAAR